MIDNNKVLAVIGNVGTPTAEVTAPLAKDKKMLMLGSYTGAKLLREPQNRYVINFRASYKQEINAIVDHLRKKEKIRPCEIAFLFQKDAYGKDCCKAAVDILWKEKQSTGKINEEPATILTADIPPRAVIMAGTYGPCARFIRMAQRAIPNAIFANVSFVGSASLAKALREQEEQGLRPRVIISQVVPHYNSNLALAKKYREDLDSLLESKCLRDPKCPKDCKRLYPEYKPSFTSFEGYIVATIFAEGIRRAPKPLTRETIIDGLHKIKNLDIGIDEIITFGKNKHQGSNRVWLTKICEKEIKPIDDAAHVKGVIH